jgi:hypothetical protein
MPSGNIASSPSSFGEAISVNKILPSEGDLKNRVSPRRAWPGNFLMSPHGMGQGRIGCFFCICLTKKLDADAGCAMLHHPMARRLDSSS